MAKLTDNKLFQISTDIDIADVNLHSYAVALGLQKLVAAKIEFIEFQIIGGTSQLPEASGLGTMKVAVINDPDDVTSLEMPDSEYEHDVIAQFIASEVWVMNIALIQEKSAGRIVFNEDQDIYALRNLRINSQCATSAWGLGAIGKVIIGFRKENISRSDLLNIVENI